MSDRIFFSPPIVDKDMQLNSAVAAVHKDLGADIVFHSHAKDKDCSGVVERTISGSFSSKFCWCVRRVNA